ncbi:sugar ABC transporter ATP-binding protein [Treponema zuelzerae]|uniref:Sugar ABC transporter ATP-binding protein n=1 Tax=Teretinema zuelzerae TaxID=156 RepID=A0AAE3JIN4_9SPIR|nr:sugar ABC transporter ATP-binding protein [Teretinema zuelzerae]MCD1653365.1 sugar ABC transporter ATP-binding protein [Teretinema zuelzerae]
MQSDKVLEMQGICKTFPGVRALSNVNFTLRKGEVHALMGENGAGKSTLVKVMTGVYEKDAGQITVEGKPVHFKSPQEAQDNGIGTVYQEITLCPNLTVAENMFIGRGRHAFVSWNSMNAKAKKLLDSLSIPSRPTQQLSSCSLAVQQMIAIARAVDMDCKILVLDEPTSSLDEDEVRKLFELMRELKSRGVGIVFITHFLDQVYEISDRITVLRNGELIGEYEAASLPQFELVSKMMGKALEDVENLKKGETCTLDGGVPVLEASGLSSDAGVKPFDFAIRKGEINGFTGLLGSGRSESVRAIYAADKVTGGEIKINGKKAKIDEPIDAMRQGIGYLPEDRKGDGIIADLSVRDNIILAMQVMKGFFRPFSRKQAEAFADEYVKRLSIKTASVNTPIKQLSGGNQQKVILGRWLLTHPKYLILDEPTRGIDVGTKVEIQKLMLKLAEEGVSVTFISSEIEEMLRTCSRLIVMKDRQIAGELTGANLTQKDVMHVIAGGHK